MKNTDEFNKQTTKKKLPNFSVGDTVAVVQKVKEGKKERLQTFEGLVIAKKHGKEPGATFTVRKVASGVGVERIFPFYATFIEKIRVVKSAKVRRSKLYYLRTATGKRSKLKKKAVDLSVAIAPDPESPIIEEVPKETSEENEKETDPNKEK